MTIKTIFRNPLLFESRGFFCGLKGLGRAYLGFGEDFCIIFVIDRLVFGLGRHSMGVVSWGTAEKRYLIINFMMMEHLMRRFTKKHLLGMGALAVGGFVVGMSGVEAKGEGDFFGLNTVGVSPAGGGHGYDDEEVIEVEVEHAGGVNVSSGGFDDYVVLKIEEGDGHQKDDGLLGKMLRFKEELGGLGLRGEQLETLAEIHKALHEELVEGLTDEQRVKLEFGKKMLGDMIGRHHGEGAIRLGRLGEHGGGHWKIEDLDSGVVVEGKRIGMKIDEHAAKMQGLLMKHLGITEDQKQGAAEAFEAFKEQVMEDVLDDDQRELAEAYKALGELKKRVFGKEGVIHFGRKIHKKHGEHLKKMMFKEGAKLLGDGGADGFLSKGHLAGIKKFAQVKFRDFDLRLTDEQRAEFVKIKKEMSAKMRELLDEGQRELFDKHGMISGELHKHMKGFENIKGDIRRHMLHLKHELNRDGDEGGEHEHGKKDEHKHVAGRI